MHRPTASAPLLVTTYFTHHGLSFFEAMLRAVRLDRELVNDIVKGRHDAVREKYFSQAQMLGCPASPHGSERDEEDVQGVLLVPAGRTADSPDLASTNWREFASKQTLEQLVGDGVLTKEVMTAALHTPDAWERVYRQASQFELLKAIEKWGVDGHSLWPLVKEAPLSQQVEWLDRHHLWHARSERRPFEICEIALDHDATGDPVAWARALNDWIDTQGDRSLIVNLDGVPSASLVAWYYLGWQKPSLKNAHFVGFRTPRAAQKGPRYRNITVAVRSIDLLHQFAPTRIDPPESLLAKQRGFAQRLTKYAQYGDGFVILVLGPRGTGKSRSVHAAFKAKDKPFVELSCAEFGEDLNLARSLLFGHLKGSFTGATRTVSGAFEDANEGTLFLDEIHHLSRPMQAMLLTALQTDAEGRFSYRPIGSSETKMARFQLVLASNRAERRLRKKMLADFWDRIHQRVVRLDGLGKGAERAAAWNRVWEHLDLRNATNPTDDPQLKDRFLVWLNDQSLPGNFRDLERVAILTSDLQRAEHTGDKSLRDAYSTTSAREPGPWWFATLREEWKRSSRTASDAKGPACTAKSGTPASTATPPFRLRPDNLSDPDRFLRSCKQWFARALEREYGDLRKAARKLSGTRTSYSTLRRWRRR